MAMDWEQNWVRRPFPFPPLLALAQEEGSRRLYLSLTPPSLPPFPLSQDLVVASSLRKLVSPLGPQGCKLVSSLRQALLSLCLALAGSLPEPAHIPSTAGHNAGQRQAGDRSLLRVKCTLR